MLPILNGPGGAGKPKGFSTRCATGCAKPATCRSLRHSFASTTMIYTRVLNQPGIGVRSPID